jgi:hypothetical protein
MKPGLCVISTKNPTPVLLNTINMIKLYYSDFDIVVVDSDSTDFTYFKDIDPEVKIEYAKNKNWELGAWCYAFQKYSNYKVYMFIQDSLTPNCRIPEFDPEKFINGTLLSFHYNASISEGGYFDELVNVYKDTQLSFISELDPNTPITGSAHSSFITNNENVRTILQLEDAYVAKNIQKTKIHSWLCERTGGLVAEKAGNIRIDVTRYFDKRHMYRDYV